MIFSPFVKIFIISLLLCSSVPNLVSGDILENNSTIYIGVLLPLSGPDGAPMYEALKLGVEHINAGGGIGGRPVSLIYRNTNAGDLQTYAEQLVKDPRIRVVIGPFASNELFQIADLFKKNQKILISPSASSDEIFRAFSETGSVWRTISSDGTITSVIMQHLAANNTTSIAMLTPNTSYGKTFYDWIPFWGIETGISIAGAEEFKDPAEIPSAIQNLVANNPDSLIFVHSGDSSEIFPALQTLQDLHYSGNLYLVYPNVGDNGQVTERLNTDTLLGSLVSGQWKMQNTSVSKATLPEGTLLLLSGPTDATFTREFETNTGIKPPVYIPQTYDAVLVAAAIMARFTAFPDKSPKNAAQSILLNATGDPLPPTTNGFQTAFSLIQNGEAPIMTGATGLLTFKPEGTDRKEPWFGTYRIEGGRVIEDPVIYQNLKKGDTTTKEETWVSTDISKEENLSSGEYWAVIGALSRDWENYRHQADALTIYQYLKKQGVSDDHIILLIYDDIPTDKRNKKPGEVYHTPGETEVRKQANPDYIGENVNKQMLQDVLLGSGEYKDNPLLESDENATVLIYLSSHGAQGGYLLPGDGKSKISPNEFAEIIQKMADNHKFGKMLVILESCFSGATVQNVTTDQVILMTASSSDETSKATTYDSELSAWLSDEFTSQLVSTLQSSPSTLPVRDLYLQIYQSVRSSHPTLIKNNGSLDLPAKVFFGG